MTMQQRLLRLILSSGVWLGLAAASPLWAGSYSVSVDTSSISGTSGYIDLQFNPGGAGTPAASATITNFSPAAILGSALPTTGDVSGTLSPGPLAINNTDAVNEYTQAVTFGLGAEFNVTISESLPNSGAPGSSFAFSLFDSNGNPLLTTDPAGTVVTLDLNPDGSTSVAYQASAATVTPAASAAPEPSSLVLLATALPAGVLAWRRRRAAAY